MNILMLGLFTGNTFDGDELLAFGFEELGHSVTKINYRKTRFINLKLLSLCKKYDLLIIGKGEAISPLILKQITIPKVLWYGDQREPIQKWLVNRVKQVDLFLKTTAGERLETYHKLTKTPSAFFMVPCNRSLYTPTTTYTTDIFFAGSPLSNLGDELRHQILNQLSKKTNFKWFGKSPDTMIKGSKYSQEICRSKVLINLNHFNSFYQYNSDRIIHYSAGGFTLSYNVPGIEKLFTHIPIFNNSDELDEKISYYLENETERENLKQKIIHETQEKYHAKKMCQYILELLIKKKSDIYPEFEIYL